MIFQLVRPQFKYVVKTSRSGKQGRKYIQVGKTSSEAPVVLRKPVKKLTTKTIRGSKSTKVGIPASGSSAKVLPGNVGKRGKRGTRLADELAQSNSDTEIPETQVARKATICNGQALHLGTKDTKETQKPVRGKKQGGVTISGGGTGGTLDAYSLPNLSATASPDKRSRPQRRKRSMEERLPDFLMEVMLAKLLISFMSS